MTATILFFAATVLLLVMLRMWVFNGDQAGGVWIGNGWFGSGCDGDGDCDGGGDGGGD